MVKVYDCPDYRGCNRKVINKKCSVPSLVPVDLQKINMVRANKNTKKVKLKN